MSTINPPRIGNQISALSNPKVFSLLAIAYGQKSNQPTTSDKPIIIANA